MSNPGLLLQGTIQFRRGTSAQWTSTNPTLAQGELGIELDTNKFKIGDGATAWNSMMYGFTPGPTFLTYQTHAAMVGAPPAQPNFVRVVADETNLGNPSNYFWNGTSFDALVPPVVLVPGVDPTISANYSGFPCEDVGQFPQFVENCVGVKQSNGLSSRYLMNAPMIAPRQLVASLNDSTTGNYQWVYDFLIPGGALWGNEVLTVDFGLNFDTAGNGCVINCGLFCEGPADPEANGVANPGTFRVNPSAQGAGLGIFQLKFGVIGANSIKLLSASAPSQSWVPYTAPSVKRANLQRDWHLKIGFAFQNAATGRIVIPDFARATIQNSVHTSDTTLTYRKATEQPFSGNSPWNTPINTGATYAADADPTSLLIGTGNPGGVSGGAYRWIAGNGSDGLPVVYEASNKDPFCTFTYGSRAYGCAWPFPATAVTNGTFQMRCQAAALTTAQTSDKTVFIRTPDKRYLIEAGGYSYNASTNTHSVGYVTVVDLYGAGITWNQIYGNSDSANPLMGEYYRAAGVPLSAGLIYAKELAAGVINHALSMQISPYQMKSGTFVVSSASGTTFVIQPYFVGNGFKLDYSPLFPSGTTFYHGGVGYTTAGTPTYNSTTGQTTLTVTATITTNNGAIWMGGTDLTSQRLYQRVWPASTVDSGSLTTNNVYSLYQGLIPMGALFAIPQSVNLSTIGVVSAEGAILAKAFQQYGGYVTDTTQNTFALAGIYSDVSNAQLTNLVNDVVAIRSALRMVTNNTQKTPGGLGTPIASPLPLLKL